jgi:hypothetical protein
MEIEDERDVEQLLAEDGVCDECEMDLRRARMPIPL